MKPVNYPRINSTRKILEEIAGDEGCDDFQFEIVGPTRRYKITCQASNVNRPTPEPGKPFNSYAFREWRDSAEIESKLGLLRHKIEAIATGTDVASGIHIVLREYNKILDELKCFGMHIDPKRYYDDPTQVRASSESVQA